MVEVATTVVKRGQRGKERLKSIKNAQPHRPGIRVEPRDDQVRKGIAHPKGMKFRPTGSVEWPNDRFTQRRLRDGTVKLAAKSEEKEAPKEEPKRHSRYARQENTES